MADQQELKTKGAASEHAEAEDEVSEQHAPAEEDDEVPSSTTTGANEIGEAKASVSDEKADTEKEEGEITADEQFKRYRWCKCIIDPAQAAQSAQDHYFLHMDSRITKWEEPDEPFWLWDTARQMIDESGLHYPSSTPPQTSSDAVDPDYSGYNPKIHGNYDPNAPYAQYHNKKREEESGAQPVPQGTLAPAASAEYAASGTFNRFNGNFQSTEKSTDRHSDYNKSGRQMGAFFDVDAAANAHDGKSLKEERRNEKLSKQQIKELKEKRRKKKEEKRLAFYKS